MIMRKIIVSIFLVLAFICSCSERSEKAFDWFNKAVALNYTDPQKSIEYLNNAIKLQPNYIDAYYIRGITYAKINQHQWAIEDYNKTISLKSDFVDAYKYRGYVYFKQGNKKLGCPDAKKACDLGNCILSDLG